jgi:hypothetical protein
MIRLENTTTNITAIDITRVGSIFTVMARAEQIPNTCMVMGLSSTKGSVTYFFLLFEKIGSAGCFITAFFSTVSVLIQQ